MFVCGQGTENLCLGGMRLSIRKFTIILLLFSTPLFSQYKSGSKQADSLHKDYSAGKIILNDLKISLDDGIKTFAALLHFDTKDAITALGVLGTTALLFTVDADVRNYFAKQNSDFNNKLSDVGNFYGSLYPTVAIGGGLYITGLAIKNEDIRVTGRMVFESAAIAGIITTLTKSLLGRHRPYTDDGRFAYEGPTFEPDFLSLPSGHATVAFALSTTLAKRINNTYASIGLYTLATVTSLSRIYEDQHWASDVFLGSAIGYFVADFIAGKKNEGKKYRIEPTGNGIQFIYSL